MFCEEVVKKWVIFGSRGVPKKCHFGHFWLKTLPELRLNFQAKSLFSGGRPWVPPGGYPWVGTPFWTPFWTVFSVLAEIRLNVRCEKTRFFHFLPEGVKKVVFFNTILEWPRVQIPKF